MDNSPGGLENGGGGPRGTNGVDLRARSPLLPLQHLYTTVVVHKDEKGYGMKVSGDNPVFVQSVKQGGAAERAGLHSGDTIIKVNGFNVRYSTHTQVVDLIKSSGQVVLTVQQSPLRERSSSLVHSPGLHRRASSSTHILIPPVSDRITAPLPVDDETQRQMDCNKEYQLRLMLENEERNIDKLRNELAQMENPDPSMVKEIARSEKMVQTLNARIASLTPSPLVELETPPPLPSRNSVTPRQAPPLQPANLPPPLPPRQYLLPQEETKPVSQPANQPASPQVPTHSHQRTKSSPENLSSDKSAQGSKLVCSESLGDLSFAKSSRVGLAWELDSASPRVTPPGTPPPPYPITNNNHQTPSSATDGADSSPAKVNPSITPNLSNAAQHSIISMEDEDMSDQELSQLENHGPFKSLSKLWNHQAHLAVFLNYVISNSDPSSLLFYLVTDLYKEGNIKEMKKWAYEIHSSFLVPGAPLRVNNVDENVAREIDDVLLKKSDKEEILRKIFWKARMKAKEELNAQLEDFQSKRTSGLNTIYGPADHVLDECIHDKGKEIKVIETILLPKLEPYLEDIEKEVVDNRRFSTGAALCTIMAKVFGVRSPSFTALIDRCPTYVSKDKSLKAKFMGRNKKQVTVRGHHCEAHQYYTVTYCNHCQNIIWGIGPQGYHCTNCALNIHRSCVKTLEENCPGPMVKKEKGNDRISKLMERIRPENTKRKPSSLNLPHAEKTRRLIEEEINAFGAFHENDSGERVGTGVGGGGGGRTERRPDTVREEGGGHVPRRQDSFGHQSPDRINHHNLPPHLNISKTKPNPASINRSESYKESVHQKRHKTRRKTSDPNLSKSNNDVELEALSYGENSGSSSNSSLSTRSLDSPCNCTDVGAGGTCQQQPQAGASSDSDMEAEPDSRDWTKLVPEHDFKQLSRHERKRQEIINELFHTERTHVRGLKVLDQVFYTPMKEVELLPPDQFNLLFPNLYEMIDLHSQFNNVMKAKRKESPIIADISCVLQIMFEGDNLERAAATFCARQHIALEALKGWRKKDPRVHSFLSDAEAKPICRRLLLKDIISTGWQRLTKYPLLLENLAKYTKEDSTDFAILQKAIERSKEILARVDQAVKEAEDSHRLHEIQRRLDKTPFDKVDHPIAAEFKNLDLTKHRLIHEGGLNWKIASRPKLIDLHVLLLEDLIILLQKQDDRYVLKFYSSTLSPVIKVSTVLVRPNAVEQNGLYLVNTSQNGAQIYELVAGSIAEKQRWFKHISEAAEAYKQREGRHRRPEAPLPHPPEPDVDKHTQGGDDGSGGEAESVSKEAAQSGPKEGEPAAPSTPQASPAQPPASKLGKLRRKDEVIRQALAEKQALVADMLNVPREEFETIADMAGEALDKDPSELLLASLNRVNQLTQMFNEAMDIGEEEVVWSGSRQEAGAGRGRFPSIPAHRLQPIVSSLIAYLTQLLVIVPEKEEERERLRRELQLCREQLHSVHEKQDFSGPSCEVIVTSEEDAPASQTVSASPQPPLTPEVYVDAVSDDLGGPDAN